MNFKQLLEDYRKGRLSAEQRAAFEQLLHSEDAEPGLQQLLDHSLENIPPLAAEETQKFIYQQIRDRYLHGEDRGRVAGLRLLRLPWLRYAAVIAILLGVGAYLWPTVEKDVNETAVAAGRSPEDILPGREGAVLTLADGSKVNLDTAGNGVISSQHGMQVMLQNGALAYNGHGENIKNAGFNTVSTPKGRHFAVHLPDGSTVWLNAASSIKYPAIFSGKERRVEMKGEAYFEVAKDPERPFRVLLNETTTVEVLGTAFNINAYEEETAIRTTLLEGAVSIHANDQQEILKPGQQARINAGKPVMILNHVDLEQVTAWKKGLFNFNGYDISSVMRELGRWYNLEIVYEGVPDQGEVMGEIQRNLTLSQVMRILEKMHIHYRLEGRKLIIMK